MAHMVQSPPFRKHHKKVKRKKRGKKKEGKPTVDVDEQLGMRKRSLGRTTGDLNTLLCFLRETCEKGFSADFSHLRTLCKSSPIIIVLHSKPGVIVVVFAFPSQASRIHQLQQRARICRILITHLRFIKNNCVALKFLHLIC